MSNKHSPEEFKILYNGFATDITILSLLSLTENVVNFMMFEEKINQKNKKIKIWL